MTNMVYVPCALVDIRALKVKSCGVVHRELLAEQERTQDGDEQFFSSRELIRSFDNPDDLFVDPDTFDICTVESGEVVSVTVSQQIDRIAEIHAARVSELTAAAEHWKANAYGANEMLRMSEERRQALADALVQRDEELLSARSELAALKAGQQSLQNAAERLKRAAEIEIERLNAEIAQLKSAPPLLPAEIQKLRQLINQ